MPPRAFKATMKPDQNTARASQTLTDTEHTAPEPEPYTQNP